MKFNLSFSVASNQCVIQICGETSPVPLLPPSLALLYKPKECGSSGAIIFSDVYLGSQKKPFAIFHHPLKTLEEKKYETLSAEGARQKYIRRTARGERGGERGWMDVSRRDLRKGWAKPMRNRRIKNDVARNLIPRGNLP